LVQFFLILGSIETNGQNNNFLYRLDDDNQSLLQRDISTQLIKTLYKVEGDDYSIKFKVSPSNREIAILENKEIIQEQFFGLTKLIIIDFTGKILYRHEGVKEFSWALSGNQMVCIAGELNDKYWKGFKPDKIFILNLESLEVKDITVENFYPFYVSWVGRGNESMIYFESEDGTISYNIYHETYHTTNYKSIDFSPDGKYYYLWESEALHDDKCDYEPDNEISCFGIFDAKTNQRIAKFSERALGDPVRWVYNQGHLFLFNRKGKPVKEWKSIERNGRVYNLDRTRGYETADNYVYDVATKDLVQKFPGFPFEEYFNPIHWEGNPNIVVTTPAQRDTTRTAAGNPKVTIMEIPSRYLEK